MSLFSTMQTSVSGMAAQSNALSTIGDNIANSGTTGYKEANAQFETILGQNSTSSYESGGVLTDVRYGVSQQGTLTSTTSSTDLAINGNGFFVVGQNGTGSYLTRAGSFVPDSSGNLVNAAGYQLMGYQITGAGTSPVLSPVNVSTSDLQFAVSTTGTLAANVPSTATAVAAADLPSASTPTSTNTTYTDKASITTYDSLGSANILDIYLTKTGTDTWQATAYQKADASASGGFPYSSSNVGTVNMTFDPTSGAITAGKTLTVTMPSGNTVAVDLSSMTQVASAFSVTTETANGNAPSKVSSVTIGTDGYVTENYTSGAQIQTYQIPVATVASPDNLTPLSGNVYTTSSNSGAMILSTAGTSGTGVIEADTLENSTVDLATELTNMIVAQRAYEANSKVLQASSDLLSVLNRLSTS